jgi:glycosyltransferase involved in cell wall biosynthesis
LQNDVVLAGAQSHEAIPSFLANADIFTLPCVIGDDNTRDGIPVSLMEAMAWRLPVVSTNIVGLPELIQSEHDGILVSPDDPPALAEAIARLANSADLRLRLGSAGADKIEREFNSLRSAQQLAELFSA